MSILYDYILGRIRLKGADGGGGGAVNSVGAGVGLSNSGTATDPVINHDPHTGDVTGATALTIALNAVDNTKLDDMPAFTLKGNDTGATADPKDLTVSEVKDLLGLTFGANCKVGTYTGDGNITQAITGIGFSPKRLKVWERITTTNTVIEGYETTSTIVDDNILGQAIRDTNGKTQVGALVSLDADGFTVGDPPIPGAGNHPNILGTIYNYWVVG